MDLFDLFARIFLDTSDYEKGLNETQKKTDSFGGKIAKGLGNTIKGAVKTATVAVGAMAAAGAAAVGTMTKAAIENYADYEQLVGGVETLFGAGGQSLQEYAKTIGTTVSGAEDAYGRLMTAQNEVLRNAEEAYKTAGLSANEYMETVTSFSAALIGSLDGDTAAAARSADQAIRDMSDNANKMGTSMEAIQNAYQGFAKQNYTMLDNLKLGYGGTKTEMERLLKDATALSGVEYDIESLSDVYSAIHVIQDELGITGTTAKEASETISGSLASTKAAWQNLLTALASGDGDISKSLDNFLTSAKNVFKNVLPVAKQALKGIAQLVREIAPVISAELPGLINDVLPPLIDASIEIVLALVDALPTIIQALVDAAPMIIERLITAIVALVPKLIEMGWDLLKAIAEGIKNSLPVIAGAASDLMNAFFRKIGNALNEVKEWGRKIIQSVKDGVMQKIQDAKNWGRDLIQNFIDGITAKWNALKEKVSNVAQTVKNFLGFSEPEEGPLSNFHTYAPDMMELFAKGIRDNEHVVRDQLAKSFNFDDQMLGLSVGDSGSFGGAYGGGSAGGILAEILDLLHEIRDNMGHDIVLSDGTLAGRMDKLLGRKALQKARGTI